jgi:acyl-CoA thioesterase FadM
VATSRLNIRYRKPVPLRTPLLVVAGVRAREGRRLTVHGTICTEAEPDVVLTGAEGLFVTLTTEQADRLFGPDRPYGHS